MVFAPDEDPQGGSIVFKEQHFTTVPRFSEEGEYIDYQETPGQLGIPTWVQSPTLPICPRTSLLCTLLFS